MRRAAVLAVLLIVASISAWSWDGGPTVAVKVIGPSEFFQPGAERTVSVEIAIFAPFHINSHLPAEEFLIPTVVNIKPLVGVKIVRVDYPQGELKKFIFSESPMSVYEGTVRIAVVLALSADFAGKEVVFGGTVGYQACDSNSCLAPDEAAFDEKFPVPANEGSEVKAVGSPAVTAPPPAMPQAKEQTKTAPSTSLASSPATTKPGSADTMAQSLEGKGLFLTFLLVFLGGLALNLTPCIYPLIPITIGYFGGQAGGKKGSLLGHALVYVLGMAVTYSILGVIAALTGSLFGTALQYPPVLIVIAAIMVALALSMFDLYEIRVPGFLSRLAGGSRRGLFGTLFMGLTVGIVAAPCIGPFVLGLLTYVGNRGSVVLGFGLFFVLALGLGVPFLFLALFSGSLNRLPRSGGWMVWVRKIFGFILAAMAVYFVQPLFPDPLLYSLTLALVMLVAGVYMAWVEPTRTAGKVFPLVRNVVGLAFFAACLLVASSGIRAQIDRTVAENASRLGQPGGAVRWYPYASELAGRARLDQKPAFIDFYADWCIPCKELDRSTFAAPEVVVLSGRFLMLKADLTSASSPMVRELVRRYKVKGVPTLVFLDASGREISDLRAVGFIDKDELLRRMRIALAAKK
jgi:thiol:disulfide interchange protein DsbD